MSQSKSFSTDDETCSLINILDKYIKSSDNLLPFQAYLQYLEEDSIDVFSIVSCVKTFTQVPNNGKEFARKFSYNSNLASTLLTISKGETGTILASGTDTVSSTTSSATHDQEIILAQKLYKIIISIDYSTQISSIDFIQKSLEKIFEKLKTEYDQFYKNCMHIEPAIYVTVILWNSTFFQCPKQDAYNVHKISKDNLTEEFVPFTIICHAKRLLKSNISEIAAYLFDKFNESKSVFLKSINKQTNNLPNASTNSLYRSIMIDTDDLHSTLVAKKDSKTRYNSALSYNSEFGSLEQLITNIIRVFSFFSVNEFSASVSAPSALAVSHHIYITDGILHAIDMIKCLERISTSAIVFSFIYSGNKNFQSASNISSGFGYVSDHYLMKFLADVTNGFFSMIDENFNISFISDRKLLYYPTVSLHNENRDIASMRSSINSEMKTSNISEETVITNNSESSSDTNSGHNLTKHENQTHKHRKSSIGDEEEEEDTEDHDEEHDSYDQINYSLSNNSKNMYMNYDRLSTKAFLKLQDKISTRRNYNNKNKNNTTGPSAGSKDRHPEHKEINTNKEPEIKFVQEYEIKNHSLHQIVKFRSQEGFYLIKVTKQIVKQSIKPELVSPSKRTNTPTRKERQNYYLISLHFKRYFTQTTIIYYKLSYYVAFQQRKLSNVDLNLNLLSTAEVTSEIDKHAISPKNLKNSDTKSSKMDKNSPRLFCELYISWDFLHLKAKYQNLVLIEQIRQALNHIQKIDNDKTFELTTLMLNPPELLKLKEPLFKLIVLNEMQKIDENNHGHQNPNIFSIQNLNFELNIRSNKGVENEFINFANVWLFLVFNKHNPNILKKNFGIHSLNIIMDHDRPIPDTYSTLFDMKNTYQMNAYGIIRTAINSNPGIFLNDVDVNSGEYHSNLIEQLNYCHELSNSQHINNIFHCQNSLNKLSTMLIEWCDIMLVENCVFLKYLNPSVKSLQASAFNKKENSMFNSQSMISMSDASLTPDSEFIHRSSSNVESSIAQVRSELIEGDLQTNKIETELSGIKNTAKPSKSDSNNGAKTNTNTSFVLVQVNKQYAPFVTLKFIFHSSISYLDRMRMLQKFKEKLSALNLKKFSSNMESPSSTPVQYSLNPRSSNSESFRTNVSNLSNTNLAQTFDSSLAKQTNHKCCYLIQKPYLFNAVKTAFLHDSFIGMRKTKGFQSGEQIEMSKFQTNVLNFMDKREFKWNINKLFSYQASLQIKENIIDSFVRIRLKEGFRCLFQNSSMAVFCVQLAMFDSGEFFTNLDRQNEDGYNTKKSANEKFSSYHSSFTQKTSWSKKDKASPDSFKSGSSQFCTIIYVINFKNEVFYPELNNFQQYAGIAAHVRQPPFSSKQTSNQLARSLSNNGFLTNTIQPNKPMTSEVIVTKGDEHYFNIKDSNEMNGERTSTSSLQDARFMMNVSFTTEIYSEVIDGIYQEKNNVNLNSYFNSGSNNLKKAKEKIIYSEYFRNLNYNEILNLIFLSDLKCSLSLQSTYALFLKKNNSITNFYSLLNLNNSSVNQPSKPFITNVYLKDSGTQDNTSNIYNNDYNINFFDSIRFLPDLRLLPKKIVKFDLCESQKTSRRILERPITRGKINNKQAKSILIMPNNPNKETAAKKKKTDMITLTEQIKPVLDGLTVLHLPVTVDFQFSLRSVLFESCLFVNVFDDVPLHLFRNKATSMTRTNAFEMVSVKKIQSLFFSNVEEHFRNLDGFHLFKNSRKASQASGSGFGAKGKYQNAGPSQFSTFFDTDDEVKNHEAVDKEIKNALILRLNDIKSGDSIVKQIIENLNSLQKKDALDSTKEPPVQASVANSETETNFQVYFKFNVAKVTSETPLKDLNQNYNQSSHHHYNNKSLNKIASMQLNDSENRFFIFGVFFLNVNSSTLASKTLSPKDNTLQSTQKQTTSNQSHTASNRLVFFLFSCVPDNIKHSIVSSRPNTYLIRKPLFSSERVFNNTKTNSNSQSDAPTNMSETYRLYSNTKNTGNKQNMEASALSSVNSFYNNNNNSGVNGTSSSNLRNKTANSIIKKSFSISDILRDHLMFNKMNEYENKPEFFLNYIDYIEETCAKSYIKSVIHYLGLYATQRLINSNIKSNIFPDPIRNEFKIDLANNEPKLESQIDTSLSPVSQPDSIISSVFHNFENKSINQLLNIGRKVKLVDLDLTKYLKIICDHLRIHKKKTNSSEPQKQENNEQEPAKFDWCECQSDEHKLTSQYLEKKFDELILKRFNTLPGFDDLFIFTPSQHQNPSANYNNHTYLDSALNFELGRQINNRKTHQRGSNSLETSQNENLCNTSPRSFHDTEADQTINSNYLSDFDYNLDETDDEKLNNNTSFDDDNSDDSDDDSTAPVNIEGKKGNLQHGQLQQQLTEDDNDNVVVLSNNEDTNSNTDFESYDDIRIEKSTSNVDGVVTIKKITKKKLKTKFRASSPFSYLLSSKRLKEDSSIKAVSPSSHPTNSSNSMTEQILGVEFVCIIGNQPDSLSEPSEQHRTRTTTLTNTDLNGELTAGQDGTPDLLMTDLKNDVMNFINPANQNKKTFFFSKFNRFNLHCILNLFEEKDNQELKTIVRLLEAQQDSELPNSEQPNSLVINDIKVYLRFNWYSFDDLKYSFNEFNKAASSKNGFGGVAKGPTNNGAFQFLSENISTAQSVPLKGPLLKTSAASTSALPQNLYGSNSGPISSNSSSSTLNNQPLADHHQNITINISSKTSHFYYYHFLNSSLNEFRWHLSDEIFQLQQTRIKNKRVFAMYINHIREGVRRKFINCRMTRHNIILNKKTKTTTTSILDAKAKTNAARLTTAKPLEKKTIEFDEDKSILNVDSNRFFEEFVRVFKDLKDRFYACKVSKIQVVAEAKLKQLQDTMQRLLDDDPKKENPIKVAERAELDKRMSLLKQINDSFYYLMCECEEAGRTLSFKILLKLTQEELKIKAPKNELASTGGLLKPGNDPSSPTWSDSVLGRYGNHQQRMQMGRVLVAPMNKMVTVDVEKETIVNQLKVNIYYSFNQSSFENHEKLIERLIREFDQELNTLIKSVYLTLTLRDIHETRKWNTLLVLKENNVNNGDEISSSSMETESETTKNLRQAETSDESTESENNRKTSPEKVNSHQSSVFRNQYFQGKLSCTCVWSVLFKLHRLHQTVQKKYGSTDVTSSSSSAPFEHQQLKQSQSKDLHYQLSQSQQQSQDPLGLSQSHQYISQGLKKLQEKLMNFRIEECSSGDLYVYTRKDENFLLKLEEVYKVPTQQQQQNTSNAAEQTITNGVSRRPSFAGAEFHEVKSNPLGRSQNLSGGSVNSSAATIAGLNASSQLVHPNSNINSTLVSGTALAASGRLSVPEYIRLNVYGLTEPDEEMKQDLCKTLQSELDYSLLIKMCNSIDKNTYKTTSAQHPDKITEEDLMFFKQICENYFDFEIALPFVFNFSRTMRENFFYFVKQIFNSNFKAIDAVSSQLGGNFLGGPFSQARQHNDAKLMFTGNRSKSQIDHSKLVDDEYDELASIIANNETAKYRSKQQTDPSLLDYKSTTQFVSSQLTQLNSFSFMSIQPSLGPFEDTKADKRASCSTKILDHDSFMIPLSRILFHNSKIGKHRVSLVLVEALYAIKSLSVLVQSRVTRSNSIGSQTNLNQLPPSNKLINNISSHSNTLQQVLETSYVPSKKTGPTFVYRFYCRGENDTNAYKLSLESALNNALLFFLSEYLTKIGPELYMKQIQLSKSPVQFRKYGFNTLNNIKCPPISTDENVCKGSQQQQQQGTGGKIKKRHKSTGSDEHKIDTLNLFSLTMNKTARQSNLGKLILSNNIIDEAQLDQFVLNNLANNLFDHRDYQETIEYFRENIRSSKFRYKYSDIINGFCHGSAGISDGTDQEDSVTALGSISSLTSIGNQRRSFSLDATDAVFEKSYDSMSNDEMDHSNISHNNRTTDEEDKSPGITKNMTCAEDGHFKSHLRIIYDWLKGLYLVQTQKIESDYSRRSNSCYSKATAFQRLPSTGNLGQVMHVSPMESQNSTASSYSSPSGVTPNPGQHQQQQQSMLFVIRKSFRYKTKYNLTALIRELEAGMSEVCKVSEVTTNYFAFSSTTDSENLKQPLATRLKRKQTKNNTHQYNIKKTVTLKQSLDDGLDNVFINEPPLAPPEINVTTTTSTTTTTITTTTTTSDLKSCLRNKKEINNFADTHINSLTDDLEFGDDFTNLKLTNFYNLQHNLSRSENLVITLNAEYTSNAQTITANLLSQQSNTSTTSGFNTISSTTTITTPSNYTRVPSNSSMNQTNHPSTNLNSSTNNVNSLMMKSISSNSGELETSLSLSGGGQPQIIPLKRTYMYALVCARTSTITFYCFTTETTTHEAIKQLLDTACENLLQRFHLANNTVLYKFGGLIGDSLISDLKKVKALTLSHTHNEFATSKQQSQTVSYPEQQSINLTTTGINTNDSKIVKQPFHATNLMQNSVMAAKKLASSPKFQRHPSYKGPSDVPGTQNSINPAFIANLQFSASNSSSYQPSTSITISPPNTLASLLSFKQIYIPIANCKPYDNINSLVNQQIYFCSQYLTGVSSTPSISTPTGTNSSLTYPSGIDLGVSQSPLTSSNSNFNTISRQNSSSGSQIALNANTVLSKIHFNHLNFTSQLSQLTPATMMSTVLYGVGMNYQLYELQQIYRHPRKIYEIAVNLASSTQQIQHQNSTKGFTEASNIKAATSSLSSNLGSSRDGNYSSLIQSPPKFQLTVNDFYKNYVLPVLIPFHYCCSPILFFTNWNNQLVNEEMLTQSYFNLQVFNNNISRSEMHRNSSVATLLSKQQSISNLVGVGLSGSSGSKVKAGSAMEQADVANELWFKKMRFIFMSEFTKFFESRGFIYLRDDRSGSEPQSSKSQQQWGNDVHHFIKWILQDGFFYITITIEDIFMHIKFGYSTRYRQASISFLNELIRFFAIEFHVHSLTYDFHLSTINRNFTNIVQQNQISLTISRFLDEFVDFFHRDKVPIYSSNKVFKICYEKLDYSLIPHKFGLIFDFMISAKKKFSKDGFNVNFMPLYLNMHNNIGIYSITDIAESSTQYSTSTTNSKIEYSKYLVIKIESYQTNTSHTTNVSTPAANSSAKKKYSTQVSSPDPQHTMNTSSRTLVKSSNSSSVSSFYQLANQSDGLLLIKQQQAQLNKSNSSKKVTNPQSTSNHPQSYIRLICHYLCINKIPQKGMEQSLESGAQLEADKRLSKDCRFLEKIIEESVSAYKREIFWDNLVKSMSPLSSLFDEDKSHMPVVFAIQSEELEQILECSDKIDALNKDEFLGEFLSQCYAVKDKIRSYFEFSFGRHFIFTSSDTFDYCLLLINDDLINKFGCSSSSSIKCKSSNERLGSFANVTTQPPNTGVTSKQLDSFILLKFNKKDKTTNLWQVNQSVTNNTAQPKSTFSTKTMLDNENGSEATPSSFKNEKNHVAAYLDKVMGANKYLSFVVNNLIYVIWENLFAQD